MENNEFVASAVENSPAELNAPAASENSQRLDLEEQIRFLTKQNELLQDTLKMQQAASAQNLSRDLPVVKHEDSSWDHLEDDAFITGAQAKKLNAELREYKKSLNEIKQGLVDYVAQQEVSKIHALYPTFEADMAQLPQILKKFPDLAQEYQRNPSPHFAMTIVKAHGKNSPKSEAQRIVDNSKQSGSLSSIGGGTVEKANDWKNMSRKEFLKFTKLN